MSQQSNHLTDIQIKEYLRSQPGNRPDGRDALFDAHLAECETCLGRTLQLQRAQLGLDRPRVSHTRHSNCPSNQTILDLAAGLGPAESTAVTIRHAAHCDFCGPLLRTYLEDFSEEMTEEAAAFLAQRPTASAAWREAFIAENNPRPEPTGPGIADWLKKAAGYVIPAPAQRWAVGAAVVAVVVGAAFFLRQDPPQKAKALALAAAPELNTMEMQLPGARYAPYKKVMGDESPAKSESLLEAEGIVIKHLGKAGRLDAKWLEVDGLTSLLEGTGSGAAKAASDFERARAEGRDDPSLEIELAISYYASDPLKHPDYLPKAIDLLEGVLKRPKLPDEDKKAALYNLAVAYENINAWELAVARWNEYLKADSSSEWAKNARARLERAKSKAPKQQSRSPADFPDDAVLQAQVEQYQDVAIRYWLPIAVKDPQSKAALYTRKLADLLAEQHSDPWLRDFLNAIHPDQIEAVKALGKAFGKNKQGLYGEAVRQSRTAAEIFSKHHNVPGELRARFEEVYANQRTLDTQDCVALAKPLNARLLATNYHWLQAQLALERATCLNLLGNLNAEKDELAGSDKIAHESRFPVLRLRISGISASIEMLQNRDEECWRRSIEGLERYGEGNYPSDRLYQFFSVMEQYAQKKHLLYTHKALLLEAISIRDTYPPEDEAVIIKGTLYEKLSTASLALHEVASANAAARASNFFLARAPDEPYADKYVLFAKIDLAKTQLHMGDALGAIETLEPVRERAQRIENDFIAGEFHGTLGDGYRRLTRLREAAEEYQTAVITTEKALATLNDESKRLKWVKGSDQVYRGLALVLLQQGKDADALKLWEWYGGRSERERGPSGQISWDGLQQEIFAPLPAFGAQTRVIYAAFEDHLQIWIVSSSRIKGHSVKIKLGELEQKVNDFAHECAMPPAQLNQDDLGRNSRVLGSIFLEPIIAELSPAQPVIVEMDQKLSKLPVAALTQANGRYFAEDFAITVSPGMHLEKGLRRPMPIRSNAPMLVAEGSGSLPGQEELIDKIRSEFANTTVLKPEQVSSVEINRKLPASEIFVLITHGVSDGSGTVVVVGEGRMRADGFHPELLKRLKLAVLEACSSGVSTENGASDPANLTRAFQAAGVPNVISTRWDVDSQTTSEFMAAFMQHLGQGETVSQAMFHARNAALRVHSHPYFWAGLDLTGRAN